MACRCAGLDGLKERNLSGLTATPPNRILATRGFPTIGVRMRSCGGLLAIRPTGSTSFWSLVIWLCRGAFAAHRSHVWHIRRPRPCSLLLFCIRKYLGDGRRPYALQNRDQTWSPSFWTSFHRRFSASHSVLPEASRP